MQTDHDPTAGTHAKPSLPEREFVQALFDWLEPKYESAVLAYSLGQDLRWKWKLLHRLRPRAGEMALDLACGTGLISDRLVRRLGRDAVVGLDINRAMLLRARQNHRVTRVVRADSVRLPFRDASFDLVTAGYLFKYVPLELLAGEIRRVLKPAGRFGGYDFSAPLANDASGWVYARYLRSVLPWMGRLRNPKEEGWAELFSFLARVATESGWETRVDAALRGAGFETIRRSPSLGGAITWVWARA
jgi:demethylmenaquinone methyltransferase / 2-methoxy-6-polyprenyl-1,4-benzoquinol methylase